MPTVFTIGHSTHDPGSFAELLARHEVQVLVDVRRYPGESGNGLWENDGFRGYADHMASEEFATAFESLLELARRRRVAVMCAEGPWWRCHRRLLADALVGGGFHVCHIDSRARAEPHRLTEGAVIEGTRVRYPPAQEQLGL